MMHPTFGGSRRSLSESPVPTLNVYKGEGGGEAHQQRKKNFAQATNLARGHFTLQRTRDARVASFAGHIPGHDSLGVVERLDLQKRAGPPTFVFPKTQN